MSVDTVITALRDLSMWIDNHTDMFFDHTAVLAHIVIMRQYLMRENVVLFDDYVDNILLAKHPDAGDFILEELFYRLEIKTREELSAILGT